MTSFFRTLASYHLYLWRLAPVTIVICVVLWPFIGNFVKNLCFCTYVVFTIFTAFEGWDDPFEMKKGKE